MSEARATQRAHVEAYRCTGSSPGRASASTSMSAPTPPRPAARAHRAPRGARHVSTPSGVRAAPGIRPEPLGTAYATLSLDRHGPTRLGIGYEVQGPVGASAIVVLGGISAGRHAGPSALRPEPGWWRGVVGPGAPLDTNRMRVVGIDWLGGPESAWTPRAPVTPADQARAIVAVLDHLGIARAAVVGASYGGMVALALAAEHPERVSRVAVLCAAHRTHPHATAVRAVQRRILALGGGGADAVALARALAMTTYRTPEEFDRRFDRRPEADDALRFPVESYLDARGEAFAERFDATAFATLSASIDLHDVEPERVRAPLLVLSVESDTLSPPWLADELAARAGGPARHVRLVSPFGHDAFLKEVDAVGEAVAGFLSEPAEVSAPADVSPPEVAR